MTLYKHAGLQFGLALLSFILWTAADSWLLLTGLNIAYALAIATALIAGITISTVLHEWSHWAGAAACGSSYRVIKKPGLFIYSFDFASNSLQQFNVMSMAGQAGSWVAVLSLYLAVPMDNPGRVMLVCAALGAAVYGGVIEWPVLRRAQSSREPLQELKKIDRSTLRQAGIYGLASGLSIWLLLS